MKHPVMSGLLAALTATLLVGCNQDLAEFGPGRVTVATDPDYGHWGALNNSGYGLQQALIYAVQDEHLAQAEYQYINRRFGNPPAFRGIVNAEGGHITALTNLFVQRGWPVPPNTATQHVVTVNNLAEAYAAGVQAEIDNIAMYNRFLSRTDLPGNWRTVFTNLRDASICHQGAFERQLNGGGGRGGGGCR